MVTSDFKTRQEIIYHDGVIKPKNRAVIGLDAGYSGTKYYTDNVYGCFPSYARLIDAPLSAENDQDIWYKDLDTGREYLVGCNAQAMLDLDDTNDTNAESFERNRYTRDKFMVICRVGLGMALMSKSKADLEGGITIQTGLPTAYLEGDSEKLRASLCKKAHFAIRLGYEKNWHEFDLESMIRKENVFVMPQPAGSLYSVMFTDDGYPVRNYNDYLDSTLVLDAGFGTFDTFGMKGRRRKTEHEQSFSDVAMRDIFALTSQKIQANFGEEIRVQAMQGPLSTGTIICYGMDDEGIYSRTEDFSPLLEEAVNEVFKKCMKKVSESANQFRGYKNIIVSGGTGDAWYEQIKNYFSRMDNIRIIKGNINDNRPLVYSNVRGYYLFRVGKIIKEKK